MNIDHIPTYQLREAAKSWRATDFIPSLFGGRKPANASLHDKIDDMIDEIDRLRKLVRDEA